MNDDNLGMKATDNSVAQPDPIKANIDEEAKAEEAFVNDEEDKVFNPFVADDDVATEEEILTDADMEIPGAVGSGSLETVVPNDPINNEETLNSEPNVNLQDLQSDIDAVAPMQDENLPSAEESIKVNVGESMQPEEKPELENTELASQMDDLLNSDGNVVENTTSEASVDSVVENTTPVAEESAATETAANPVAEAVAANPVMDNATPVVDNTNPSVVAAEPVKKKKKTGLIIGIVILVLLLIGGGIGAVLFVNWHESKEKVASDAMSKLFNAKLVDDKLTSSDVGLGVTSISGDVTITKKDVDKFEDDDYYAYLESMKISLDAKSEGVSESVKLGLEGSFNNGDKSKVEAEGAYIAGGKIYFKIGEIADYEGLGDVLSGSKQVREYSHHSLYDDEEEDEEDPDVAKLEEKLSNILTSRISNQWIEISNDAIKNLLGSENYHDEYSCITDGYEKATKENKDKILEAYQNNSFLEFGEAIDDVEGAKDGLTYYEIKINEETFEKFTKAVSELETANDITKCFESIAEEYPTGLTSVDLLDKSPEEKKVTPRYYFGIKSWSHEVKNVIVVVNSDSTKLVANFDLDYEKISVSAPSDAKSIDKIAEDAWKEYIKTIDENFDTYIESRCGGGSAYFRSYCEQDIKESFDAMKDKSFSEYIQENLFSKDDAYDNCDGMNCIEIEDDDDWEFSWDDEDF